MERTAATDAGPGADGLRGDLTTLLLALWRNRVFVVLVTVISFLTFFGYSFTQRPVLSAQVTILPQAEDSSAALLWPLASVIGAPLGTPLSPGGNYEQLYAQIVVSDRILDKAIAESWDHAGFSGPVSLFEVFDVEMAGSKGSAREIHRLKTILRTKVISFSRKKNGFMVLTVEVAEDGDFAADLANYLVDQLDFFIAKTKTNKAGEQYEFLVGRLAATEKDLLLAEETLTDFKVNNRSYASSPELQQEYGVLNRELQAQTSIWVELRKQLELAEIEKYREDTTIDILDRATDPVVNRKSQRSLYGVVGLFGGFFFAVILLIIKSQFVVVRNILKSSPPE